MNRRCSGCGTQNRVPARYLARKGRCGSCKADLPPLDQPVDVGEPKFREVVKESEVPVLVDFWASWCGPCRASAPAVERLARDLAGQLVVLKVNTEEQGRLASQYRVQSIPNFILFKGGKVAAQQAGFPGEKQLKSWIERN